MDNQKIIINKAEFESTATTFLDKKFKPALDNSLGDIEIRTFPNGKWPEQYFYQSIKNAAEIAYDLCNSGIDVYFGVNPRTGRAGKKENVHYAPTPMPALIAAPRVPISVPSGTSIGN